MKALEWIFNKESKKIDLRARYKTSVWLLITILLVYSVFATFLAVKNESKILVFSVEKDRTRFISDSSDPELSREKLRFLKVFSYLYTNYNKHTFTTSLEEAMDWVSDSVWDKYSDEIINVKKEISSKDYVQKARIVKIESVGKDEFKIELSGSQIRRAKKVDFGMTLFLKIEKADRTKENPWSWQITELREEVSGV